MAKNYDFIYGKGVAELFGEELLDYIDSDMDDNDEHRIFMELTLTQRLKILNYRYHKNSSLIESSLDLSKQFWNFYKLGITFIAKFLGYVEIKNKTREDLSYYLMEYLVDGNCNSEFITDTFTCMVLVKGDLDRLSHK